MLGRIGFLGLACALVLAACEPSRQTARPAQDQQIREIIGVGESLRFPRRVGIFDRGPVFAYAEGLQDVSIGYNSTEGADAAVSTIYIYPVYDRVGDAETTFNWEFDTTKAQIARYPGGSWEVRREAVDTLQPAGPIEGLSATYRFRTSFMGEIREVFSELHLFMLGDRFVKFRHTYPVELEDFIRPHLDDLMASLRWADVDEREMAISLGQEL